MLFFIMSKIDKPTPEPFTFSRKWIIWSVAMLAVAIVTARDETGTKNQINMLISVLGFFVVAPYLIVNLNRWRKIRRAAKEASIEGFADMDKSILSEYSAITMVTRLGYSMLVLFLMAFVTIFFDAVDPTAVFGLLYLIAMTAGMLYAREYALKGSMFWYFYIIIALLIIGSFSFGLLFLGTVATAFAFPLIFYSALIAVIGLIKNRPKFGAQSPNKWIAIVVLLGLLTATVVSTI
jgi:hypothetical protein